MKKNKFLFTATIIFLIITSIFHILTYFNFNINKYVPVLFFFHILTMICFVIPLIILITKNIENKDKKKELFKLTPIFFIIFFILGSYTSFNAYYINLKLKKGSHVEIENNKYILVLHDKTTKKEISREEYYKEKNYDFRFFSNGWIMFLSVSLFIQKEILKKQELTIYNQDF